MPRFKSLPPVLRIKPRGTVPDVIKPNTPRLWNAHRRIKKSHGLTREQFSRYHKNPLSTEWRSQVSEDVLEYADKHFPDKEGVDTVTARELSKLSGKYNLLRNPSKFFGMPHNVPVEERKQVSFPDFTITLLRTPHVSPFYATFEVPLWFNKLDLKDYLLSLYGVQTVHIRSYIKQFHLRRVELADHRRQGKLYRPKASKRMNAQLVDAFEWPKETTDFSEFDKEEYWRASKAQIDVMQKQQQIDYEPRDPDMLHRKTMAEQARDILEKKRQWKPTWQLLAADRRVMEGIADQLPKKPRPRGGKRSTHKTLPLLTGGDAARVRNEARL